MTRAVRAAVLAAATTTGMSALLGRLARRPRWQRTNYRGRTVSLVAGPAVAAGALAPVATVEPAIAFAGWSAAALGLYDDLYGDVHARGLRGHLTALRQGRVTTGMVKLGGLVAAGLGTAVVRRRGPLAAVADAVLIAGCANLLNLLDLRPGRALKVAGGVAVFAASRGDDRRAAAGVVGAVVAALPADLREVTMIGDCGANALGALLGAVLSRDLGDRGRSAALGLVVGLTLASERVSFTTVIERTPWLRAVDAWGRTR